MAKEIDLGYGGAVKKVKKVYGGVGGAVKELKKGYCGVGGAVKTFFAKEAFTSYTVENSLGKTYDAGNSAIKLNGAYSDNTTTKVTIYGPFNGKTCTLTGRATTRDASAHVAVSSLSNMYSSHYFTSGASLKTVTLTCPSDTTYIQFRLSGTKTSSDIYSPTTFYITDFTIDGESVFDELRELLGV